MAENIRLMERVEFQLFVDAIAVAINALSCALWHFSYTLVIEISRHVAQVQGSVRTAREMSHADPQAFLAPRVQFFGRPERRSSWTSVRPYINSVNQFRTFLTSIQCGPWTSHN